MPFPNDPETITDTTLALVVEVAALVERRTPFEKSMVFGEICRDRLDKQWKLKGMELFN